MSRHAAGQRMELEVKFLLPSEADASLEGCPALQSVDVRSAHEVTTYFDTPAGDLARKGLSLRVRRRGLRQVQTLTDEGKRYPLYHRTDDVLMVSLVDKRWAPENDPRI